MEGKNKKRDVRPLLNVIIVNANFIERLGLKAVLEEEYNLELAILPTNLRDILEGIETHLADLIIIDIPRELEGKSEILCIIEEIKELDRIMPILLIGCDSDKEIAPLAMKSGANGYYDKSCSNEELIEAVSLVIEGKLYTTQNLSDLLTVKGPYSYQDSKGQLFMKHLTNREFQIMNLLLAGNKPNEISRKTLLSEKTICTYKRRIFDKLNINTVEQLVQHAIKYDLYPGGIMGSVFKELSKKAA